MLIVQFGFDFSFIIGLLLMVSLDKGVVQVSFVNILSTCLVMSTKYCRMPFCFAFTIDFTWKFLFCFLYILGLWYLNTACIFWFNSGFVILKDIREQNIDSLHLPLKSKLTYILILLYTFYDSLSILDELHTLMSRLNLMVWLHIYIYIWPYLKDAYTSHWYEFYLIYRYRDIIILSISGRFLRIFIFLWFCLLHVPWKWSKKHQWASLSRLVSLFSFWYVYRWCSSLRMFFVV